jgi:hypothetical protein
MMSRVERTYPVTCIASGYDLLSRVPVRLNLAQSSQADWKVPRDVHGVRSFLGLANYFRRFLQGYSKMVVPLTDLTRKDMRFIWTSECQEAFEKVKHALTNAPVLAPPELGKPFEVVSDASGVGLGAILLQDGRPVAFESRKLSPAEQNYTVTEQEMLGVVHALKTWR